MSRSCLKSNEFLIKLSKSFNDKQDSLGISHALENKEQSNLSGRQPVYFIMFNGKKCVLRFFFHGGLLRNLFKGNFWERDSRAFRELSLLDHFSGKGLPVVTPVFAGKTEGLFYRQFIVTEFLDNASDLFSLKEINYELLKQMFETIENFFNEGLIHPDLNIKNILLCRNSQKLFLLDFDKAETINRPVDMIARKKIYERLFRSFHKMDRMAVFSGFDFGNQPEYIRKAYDNYLKKSKIRSLLWIFNKK